MLIRVNTLCTGYLPGFLIKSGMKLKYLPKNAPAVDTMTWSSKNFGQSKKVNKRHVIIKWNYLYLSCGLAQEMIACF